MNDLDHLYKTALRRGIQQQKIQEQFDLIAFKTRVLSLCFKYRPFTEQELCELEEWINSSEFTK